MRWVSYRQKMSTSAIRRPSIQKYSRDGYLMDKKVHVDYVLDPTPNEVAPNLGAKNEKCTQVLSCKPAEFGKCAQVLSCNKKYCSLITGWELLHGLV
jgi:hypothetical protein